MYLLITLIVYKVCIEYYAYVLYVWYNSYSVYYTLYPL